MAPNDESVGTIAATPPEAGVVDLTPAERTEVVVKKATCPFLGSAIATERLRVRNRSDNPLASVQDVMDLGNMGGGDLGKVLGIFARGNHQKMRGPSGALDARVPPGMFSLDLPGSQGSHAGHSGILQGDPGQLDSGRFSDADFARLLALGHDGFIRRSDFAHFIADNFHRDANARSLPIAKWAREVVDLSRATFQRLSSHNQNAAMDKILESFTGILGANNLLGSAGEFGLLLAFLHNSPRTRLDQDPAFSVEDITAMFKDKMFPERPSDPVKPWKKSALDWVLHTLKLANGALLELVRMGTRGVVDLVKKDFGVLMDLVKMGTLKALD